MSARTTTALVATGAAALAAALVTATAVAYTTSGSGTPALERPLRHLAEGDWIPAERSALTLAQDRHAPVQRAWLVVASARQQLGDHKGAISAYERFLADCHSQREREFVARQVERCRKALQRPAAFRPPSQWLTRREREQLAEVTEDVYTESSEHFIIRARNPHLPKLLAEQAEQALERICTVILPDQEYPHCVDIHVWPDRKSYLAEASDSPEWSGASFRYSVRDGVAIRRIDLTQLDEDGHFAEIMLDRILPHEMTHLVSREFFGDSACPLFLDEGLAMLAEYKTDPQRLVVAGAALAGDERIDLGQLFALSRYTVSDPAIFYAEAYSLTRYLHGRMSTEQFRHFLEAIKDGCTVGDAIQRGLFVPGRSDFVADLAEAWRDHAVTDAKILRALQAAPEQLTLDDAR